MRSKTKRLLTAGVVLAAGCASWSLGQPAVAAPPRDRLPARSDRPPAEGAGYPEPPSSPASSALPDDPPPPPTQGRPVRYDNVGYAAWSDDPGTFAAAHASLPPGSFVEVTSLDTGKTILVPITGVSRPGREIELSGLAAQQLGLDQGGRGGVRVRSVNATGADLGALQAGRMPPARPDTPPVLLNALRKKLTGTLGQLGGPVQPRATPAAPTRRPVATAPSPRPAPARPATVATPPPAAGRGYYVQVAALSDPARAQALARQAGGSVSSVGRLHRVRLGPFADQRAAQAARDGAARRGYADARIVRPD